jgi:hypothetical protein
MSSALGVARKGEREMSTGLWLGITLERDRLEEVVVDGKRILK